MLAKWVKRSNTALRALTKQDRGFESDQVVRFLGLCVHTLCLNAVICNLFRHVIVREKLM
jgi:hypothetical protein